jgi:hypothetical protein
VALALAGAVACSRAQARVTPEAPPPLVVPPPPPRLVEAIERDERPQVEAVQDTAPPPAETKPAPAPAHRAETPRPEPPKPEAPVEAAKPPEEPPRATLKTAPSEREQQIEANVRRLMKSASGSLDKINPNRLNADAKGQFESARGFLRQAEEALKVRNLVLAETVADKAATIAAQLAGR